MEARPYILTIERTANWRGSPASTQRQPGICSSCAIGTSSIGWPLNVSDCPTRVSREKGMRAIRSHDVTVEQLASEVYIRVWEKRKLCSYEERAEFRWWYALVVKNVLEDLRREEGRIGPPGERVPLMREDGE